MSPSSLSRRILAASVLFPAVALTTVAPSAAARVTIVPGEVPGGGTETLAVRVGSQKPGVPTTGLELEFPADVPLDAARPAPVDGWTADVEADRTVRSVSWSGGRISPGMFEQFLLTLSPLPERGRLAFTAVQTYADGSVERWEAAIDGPAVTIGGREPAAAQAQPVPTPGPGVVVTRTDPSAPVETTDTADGDSWPPALLGLIPLVGGAALVAGLRRRRPAEPTIGPAPADGPVESTALRSDLALFERAFTAVATPELIAARSTEPRPTGLRSTGPRSTGRHALSARPVARHALATDGRLPTSESETMTFPSDPDATAVLPRIDSTLDATRPLERVAR